MTYTIAELLWMLNDPARLEAYAAALRHTVRPGDRVVDVGCGFGFLAVLACRAGASHVDAIDVDPAVTLGPQLAAENGYGNMITFHHADARRVTLPVQADVLVSDLRGALPLAGDSLLVHREARQALLRRGGRVIARRDELWVAPCVAPESFRSEVMAPHAASLASVVPVQQHLCSVPYRCTVLPAELLGAGQRWATIDYERIVSLDLGGEVTLSVARDGLLEALALWFDTDLAPGVALSNAPGSAARTYRQVLLPLLDPVPVRAGARLRVSLRAAHTARGYVWEWRGWYEGEAGAVVFDQNSMVETILDPALLPPPPSALVAARGPRADALYWLLAQMGAGATIGELANVACARWPGLMPDVKAAQAWVQSTVQRLHDDERGAE